MTVLAPPQQNPKSCPTTLPAILPISPYQNGLSGAFYGLALRRSDKMKLMPVESLRLLEPENPTRPYVLNEKMSYWFPDWPQIKAIYYSLQENNLGWLWKNIFWGVPKERGDYFWQEPEPAPGILKATDWWAADQIVRAQLCRTILTLSAVEV